jgi:hypothetical protein
VVPELLRGLIRSLLRRAGAIVARGDAKSFLEGARSMGGVGKTALKREPGDGNVRQRSLPQSNSAASAGAGRNAAMFAINDRRACAARPRDRPLGRLERNGRSRAWHHDRPAERHAEWRFRPAQRRGGDRVLGHWINGPLSRAQLSERQGRRQAQSRSPFMHAVIKAVFPSDSVLPQPR